MASFYRGEAQRLNPASPAYYPKYEAWQEAERLRKAGDWPGFQAWHEQWAVPGTGPAERYFNVAAKGGAERGTRIQAGLRPEGKMGTPGLADWLKVAGFAAGPIIGSALGPTTAATSNLATATTPMVGSTAVPVYGGLAGTAGAASSLVPSGLSGGSAAEQAFVGNLPGVAQSVPVTGGGITGTLGGVLEQAKGLVGTVADLWDKVPEPIKIMGGKAIEAWWDQRAMSDWVNQAEDLWRKTAFINPDVADQNLKYQLAQLDKLAEVRRREIMESSAAKGRGKRSEITQSEINRLKDEVLSSKASMFTEWMKYKNTPMFAPPSGMYGAPMQTPMSAAVGAGVDYLAYGEGLRQMTEALEKMSDWLK